MALNLKELKEWPPEIADLAQSARDAATNHTDSADFYRSLIAVSAWEGQGADAARSAMAATAGDHDAAAESIGAAARRMDLVHQDAEELAETIKRILDDAATEPAVTVDETTNQVIAPDTSHMTEEYAAQVAAKVSDLQGRIAAALADGERVDAELAGAITAAGGTAAPAVKSAGSLENLLLPRDGEQRKSTPENLDSAMDQLTGERGDGSASPKPGEAGGSGAPPTLDPAKVQQFKELARQTMLRDGVPPEQIEQRLDAIVAAAQKPLPAAKPSEDGPKPRPSFADGFADGWFNTEEGIKDLVGANGWEDLNGAWTDMAKGTWERATHPIDALTDEVEHLTTYPEHYLGQVAGGTALTAPGAAFGGEAALAARGVAGIPDDVIHTPSAPGTFEHSTPLEQDLPAIGDQLTISDALPDFGHFPDTGPYPLPEPSLLTTPSDGAFFWSGRSVDGTGIGPLTAGGNGAADLIAHGSRATTLESLLEQNGIQPPKWSPNDVHAENWWSAVSQMYAEKASGEVHAVIGSTLRPGNVWENVELPRLMENPNITRIIVIDPDTGIETTVFQRQDPRPNGRRHHQRSGRHQYQRIRDPTGGPAEAHRSLRGGRGQRHGQPGHRPSSRSGRDAHRLGNDDLGRRRQRHHR